MSASLVETFSEELRSLGVTNATVLAAVSGGPDSVALLRLLYEVRNPAKLQIVVAHFNHGLRAPEADQDEQFVVALAEELGLPHVVGHGRPQDRAAGETTEEWARRCRYAFLLDAARQHQANYIATGHTSDDQAETVLHRVVRGTGLTGLTGIPVRRQLAPNVTLIRPMLHLGRDRIIGWLREHGFPYRVDATNRDPRFTRNRIRHEVIPLLEQINPRVRDALCRLSTVAAEVVAILEPLVNELRQRAVLSDSEDRVILSVPALARAPGILVREVFRQLWAAHRWPEQQMTFEHWHQLSGLVHGREGAWELPGGVRARRLRGTVVLERAASGAAAPTTGSSA